MADQPDTEKIFERLSASLGARPCYQSIDMRGRVTAPCKRFTYNDRVHYLDDVSLQIFQDGLQRNHGVYSVDTFEAVYNGPHTLPGLSQTADTGDGLAHPAGQEHPVRSADGQKPMSDSDKGSRTEYAELVNFGYFMQRSEARLRYACNVEVHHQGSHMEGVIKDISVSGVQVQVAGTVNISKGEQVELDFTGLENQLQSEVVNKIPYRVIRTETSDVKSLLHLRLSETGSFPLFTKFISALVDTGDSAYKLDIRDDYQSALSWYFERLYAESSSLIPFFVGQEDNGELRVQSVSLSEGNRYLAQFFCTSEDNYNFTPLCIPGRLQTLQAGESLLIAMYRGRGDLDRTMRIHSASRQDYASDEAFTDFIDYVLTRPEHCIARIMAGPVPAMTVPPRKIRMITDKLRDISEERFTGLHGQLDALRYVGYVADMTGHTRSWREGAQTAEPASGTCFQAWVGSELRDITTGRVQDKLQLDMRFFNPQLVRFGYVERRREHRYLARTAVEIQIRDETHRGATVDLSLHGLRVQVQEKVKIRHGAMIKLGLSSMQKKRRTLDLTDIPYRIVDYYYENEKTILMLERITGERDTVLSDFFEELITRNIDKLKIDTGDVDNATRSSVFEAVHAINTQAISFFIGRNKKTGACLQFIGIPGYGNTLSRFCFADSKAGLGYLFSDKVVKALYDAVHLLARQQKSSELPQAPYEFDMYVLKSDRKETGNEDVRVITGFDIHDESTHQSLLEEVKMDRNWRVLRIVATYAVPVQDKLFEKLQGVVQSQSGRSSIKLSDAVSSVIGCGEIFDITPELAMLSKS